MESEFALCLSKDLLSPSLRDNGLYLPTVCCELPFAPSCGDTFPVVDEDGHVVLFGSFQRCEGKSCALCEDKRRFNVGCGLHMRLSYIFGDLERLCIIRKCKASGWVVVSKPSCSETLSGYIGKRPKQFVDPPGSKLVSMEGTGVDLCVCVPSRFDLSSPSLPSYFYSFIWNTRNGLVSELVKHVKRLFSVLLCTPCGSSLDRSELSSCTLFFGDLLNYAHALMGLYRRYVPVSEGILYDYNGPWSEMFVTSEIKSVCLSERETKELQACLDYGRMFMPLYMDKVRCRRLSEPISGVPDNVHEHE